MCVVGAQKKEHNGYTQEKLLGRSILGAVVDLLPHVEIVVGSSVELEWHPTDVVKHDVRAKHIRNVGQRPGRLLGYAGDDVVKDLEADD